MVSLNYVVKNTDRFKRTNTATLYRYKSDVFKVIERGFFLYNELVCHIKNNQQLYGLVSPRIILPSELIIDDDTKVKGYRCDYVDGKNLETLAKDLSTEEKINLANQLTSLLKEINHFLVVGDINLGNCMYDKNGKGYLIDFDLSAKLDEEPSLVSLYNFRNEGKRDIRSSLNTDKVKMAVVVASILYNFAFEDCLTQRRPYSDWNKFLQYTKNSYLKDYFKSSLHNLSKEKNVDDYLYLPNNTSFVKLIEEDKKRIRKLVK